MTSRGQAFASWGASLLAQTVKHLPAMPETQVQCQEDTLEKKLATHSSILAWRIPWTEEPGGLQSLGSQLDQTEQQAHTAIKTGKRKCLPFTIMLKT